MPAAGLDRSRAFVLLDDARAVGAAQARLFLDPVEIVSAYTPDEVPALLETLDRWQADGSYAAGYLAYEAGHALDPALASLAAALPGGWPLGWFARFDRVTRIASADVPAHLPDPAGVWIGQPKPAIDYQCYAAQIDAVLDAILAGTIYQANLTFAATVALIGDPLAAYARLRSHARAGYGGVVWTGTHWLLSLSPELFVSRRGDRVVTRPMKGTAARAPTAKGDAAAVAALAADPKQRAENLMIVDLIRNDLSRVAVPGSVAVPSLFRVETYPTIHQMVSDVTATVRPGIGSGAMLSAIFPCGSITGAPKIAAITALDRLEAAPRGAYTGSIGFLGPDEAAFNVAIRTLALSDGDACATLGLGSGIVADSEAASEWRECLAKGGYVDAARSHFDLIETMAFDPREGVLRLEAHLKRLGNSARAFDFAFDQHAIRNLLQQATFRVRDASRIRLRLSPRGQAAIAVDPMAPAPDGPVAVRLAQLPVAPSDFRLCHKTSDRRFYDTARNDANAFEVVFERQDELLTEGSFTSLFVERDSRFITPPLALGLQPGILRGEMIANGRAVEGELRRVDLVGGFFIGNALRGLLPARLA